MQYHVVSWDRSSDERVFLGLGRGGLDEATGLLARALFAPGIGQEDVDGWIGRDVVSTDAALADPHLRELLLIFNAEPWFEPECQN